MRLSPPVYFLMTELCIRCGKPTIYNSDTPVSDRLYFIEGSGQLCQSCYEVIYGEECQASLYSSDVPARISPDEGEKDKTGEAEVPEEPEEQTAKERLKMARKLHPLHKSDFTAAELEKLKALAPDEYELLS